MTKSELISVVAQKVGMSKKDSEKAVTAVFDTIIAKIAAGEKVQINNFGVFSVKKRLAREARNPRTGAIIKVAATKIPVFKAGKNFKESL